MLTTAVCSFPLAAALSRASDATTNADTIADLRAVHGPNDLVLGHYILSGAYSNNTAPPGGWPVVLVHHGGSENAKEILEYSKLGSLEAVVISLEGQKAYNKLSWMNAFIWLESRREPLLPRNDVHFTQRVLEDVARKNPGLPLDMARIYATGKSDGAGMAVFLAAHQKLREFKLRAIAPISGAYFGVHDTFQKQTFKFPPTAEDYRHIVLAHDPIPVLEMHGDADPVMPYEGQRDRNVKALEHYNAGQSFWAKNPGFELGSDGVPLAHTANIPDYWKAWAQEVNAVRKHI